jgi:hypothetical protein
MDNIDVDTGGLKRISLKNNEHIVLDDTDIDDPEALMSWFYDVDGQGGKRA